MIGIGMSAGKSSVKSEGLVGIGFEAGSYNENSDYSTFIGYQTGKSAKICNNSIMQGLQAGFAATGVSNSIVIGRHSAYNALSLAGQDLLIGGSAGYGIKSKGKTIAIGLEAGKDLLYSEQSICIGYQTGENASGVSKSLFIGNGAGEDAGYSRTLSRYPLADHGTQYKPDMNKYNVGVGYQALRYLDHGQANVAVGYLAGYHLGDYSSNQTHGDTKVENNIMIGYAAGSASLGQGNIYIGSDHCGNRVQGDYNLFMIPIAKASLFANTNNVLITNSSYRHFTAGPSSLGSSVSTVHLASEEYISNRINLANTIGGVSSIGSRSAVIGKVTRTNVDDTTSALTVVPDNTAQKGVMLDWDTANAAPLLASKTDPLKTGLTSIPNSYDFSTNTIVNQNGFLTIPTFRSYEELITAIPENASNEGAIAMYFNRKDTNSNRRNISGWRMVVLLRSANSSSSGPWVDGGSYKWHELPTHHNNFTWDWWADNVKTMY
jgi:hypothetical protein